MSAKRLRSCSSSSSSSLEIISHNEEIMTEILLYLPVKSILRFWAVSRQWHHLLTHTRFIQRYSHNKSITYMLFFNSSNGIQYFRLKGDNHNLDMADFGFLNNNRRGRKLYVQSSCHGLLLLFSDDIRNSQRPKRNRNRFYVFNPLTRKYTELKVLKSLAKARAGINCKLAFDPSKSPHYKVIFIWAERESSDDFVMGVYSSETRTCVKLGYKFGKYQRFLVSGAFFNGAVHFISIPPPSWYPYYLQMANSSSILHFDINQELMTTFPMAPCSNDWSRVKYVGECRGHYYLISYLHAWVFDVFKLREDYSSWFVKYKVDIGIITADFQDIIIDKMPRFFSLLEEDEGDMTLVLLIAGQILAHNLVAKTTKKLCRCEDPDFFYINTFRCFDSLYDV